MALFEREGLSVADHRGIYVRANGRQGSSVLLMMPDGRLMVTREYRAAVQAVDAELLCALYLATLGA